MLGPDPGPVSPGCPFLSCPAVALAQPTPAASPTYAGGEAAGLVSPPTRAGHAPVGGALRTAMR
eukprot:336563-Alexandrium_andersonii.AAC.1